MHHCGAQWPCPEALVRRYPGQKVTRWCAFTGRAFPHETEAITAAGFGGYLVKPADMDKIIAVIVELTRRD
jgi:hypothetical protein